MDNHQSSSVKVWRVRIFAVTWLSYAGFYFCRKAFGIVKPVLVEDYGFSNMQLAWCWGTYLTTYMFGQFLSSKLGQRYTCRRMLLGGMALSLFMNILIGFSTYGASDNQSVFIWLVVFGHQRVLLKPQAGPAMLGCSPIGLVIRSVAASWGGGNLLYARKHVRQAFCRFHARMVRYRLVVLGC